MLNRDSKAGVLRSALKVWMLPAVLILAAQGAALHVLSIPEKEAIIPQLANMPEQLGPWKTVSEQALDPAVEEYLKPDSYLLRDYSNGESAGAINLFVAYFKSLQSGYGPHSPSVCLPGNGWLVRQRAGLNFQVPGRDTPIPVNKFLMEKAGQHILVIYWYQNDRNVWADEFQGKLRLLPDLIKYKRSDASLVRLVQSITGEEDDEALAESQRFTKVLFPALADDFRRTE